MNKEDNPGVIQKAGELLHEYIPLHFLQVPKSKTAATDFPTRIYSFMQNHMTRANADFTLQVAHDAELNTPMKALEGAGIVERLPEGELPAPGHSGKSIFGKKKPRLVDAPEPTPVSQVGYKPHLDSSMASPP